MELKPPTVVKAPEGCETYLTPGKEYKVISSHDEGFYYGFVIIDDAGEKIYAAEEASAHLNGGDWIIVSREP